MKITDPTQATFTRTARKIQPVTIRKVAMMNIAKKKKNKIKDNNQKRNKKKKNSHAKTSLYYPYFVSTPPPPPLRLVFLFFGAFKCFVSTPFLFDKLISNIRKRTAHLTFIRSFCVRFWFVLFVLFVLVLRLGLLTNGSPEEGLKEEEGI